MNRPKWIYVSGPYTADTDEEIKANVHKAIKVAVSIFKKGHYPIVPHLSYWLDAANRVAGLEMSWHDWMKLDIELLKKCDALFYIAPSKGANIEKETAISLNKPVYTDTEEIPEFVPCYKRIQKVYKFDDGETHWIVAESLKEAIDYYLNIFLDEDIYEEVSESGFEVEQCLGKMLDKEVLYKDGSLDKISLKYVLDNVMFEIPSCLGTTAY